MKQGETTTVLCFFGAYSTGELLCKREDIVALCRAKEDNAETRTTVLAIETHHGKTSLASEQMTYIHETYCVCLYCNIGCLLCVLKLHFIN